MAMIRVYKLYMGQCEVYGLTCYTHLGLRLGLGLGLEQCQIKTLEALVHSEK